MGRFYVVMVGGRGGGRAIVERVLWGAEDNTVVAIEVDTGALA